MGNVAYPPIPNHEGFNFFISQRRIVFLWGYLFPLFAVGVEGPGRVRIDKRIQPFNVGVDCGCGLDVTVLLLPSVFGDVRPNFTKGCIVPYNASSFRYIELVIRKPIKVITGVPAIRQIRIIIRIYQPGATGDGHKFISGANAKRYSMLNQLHPLTVAAVQLGVD